MSDSQRYIVCQETGDNSCFRHTAKYLVSDTPRHIVCQTHAGTTLVSDTQRQLLRSFCSLLCFDLGQVRSSRLIFTTLFSSLHAPHPPCRYSHTCACMRACTPARCKALAHENARSTPLPPCLPHPPPAPPRPSRSLATHRTPPCVCTELHEPHGDTVINRSFSSTKQAGPVDRLALLLLQTLPLLPTDPP